MSFVLVISVHFCQLVHRVELYGCFPFYHTSFFTDHSIVISPLRLTADGTKDDEGGIPHVFCQDEKENNEAMALPQRTAAVDAERRAYSMEESEAFFIVYPGYSAIVLLYMYPTVHHVVDIFLIGVVG